MKTALNKLTMKNETISRIVLILEIGAIILFHSLKTAPPENDQVVRSLKEPISTQFHASSPTVVLTSVK
jgi:hypothetical protein